MTTAGLVSMEVFTLLVVGLVSLPAIIQSFKKANDVIEQSKDDVK